MTQHIGKLENVPDFSDIPLAGHEATKAINKILIDPETGSRNFMLIWAKLEPGSGAGLHSHASEQAYYILQGSLKVMIEGSEYVAQEGTSVFIPVGAEHKVEVTGDMPAVLLTISLRQLRNLLTVHISV